MAHDYSHHPALLPAGSLDRAFLLGIALNLLFVVAEFAAGFLSGSMGLLSDAGHNLSDVASLLLAMLAFRLTRVKPNGRYTYGYRKSTVLVSLTNAVILLVAVGVIVVESLRKLIHPEPVVGGTIVWVAGVGVVVNLLTALLFLRDKDRDLNVKGAFLHMAADALVSVGVMVSGAVILLTGWTVVDPIVGLLVAGAIVWSTWGLLRDSLRLSLDGVPAGVDCDAVRASLLARPGVEGVHHLHIWALSTTETALTAHVVVADLATMPALKESLKEQLAAEGIVHATLEFETPQCACHEGSCTCGTETVSGGHGTSRRSSGPERTGTSGGREFTLRTAGQGLSADGAGSVGVSGASAGASSGRAAVSVASAAPAASATSAASAGDVDGADARSVGNASATASDSTSANESVYGTCKQ